MSGRHEALEADEGHRELVSAPLQGMVEAKLEQLKAQLLALSWRAPKEPRW